MREFQNKKKIKRILHSPFTLVFLMIVLGVMAKAAWNVQNKAQLSAENLERQKSELTKLSLREQNLAQAIEYLKTEEGIETEIRSKFRLARDGESIAVIVDNDASTTREDMTIVATSTPEVGFWGKLFGWFKD